MSKVGLLTDLVKYVNWNTDMGSRKIISLVSSLKQLALVGKCLWLY